jgi:hypothetical protein
LQDGWRWGRTAKLRPRRTLGPEPGCCLQDRGRGASGPWSAAEPDSARPSLGEPRGTASSSLDSEPATSANCRCRPGDRPNRRQLCGDDILVASAAGTPQPYRPLVADEIGKGGRDPGRAGTAAEAFLQRDGIYFKQKYPGRFRNWCRVLPHPRQLGAFPQTPSEGVPPPASPLPYWCIFKPTGAVHRRRDIVPQQTAIGNVGKGW